MDAPTPTPPSTPTPAPTPTPTVGSTRAGSSRPATGPDRLLGLGLTVAGLVATLLGAAVVHVVGHPDGTFAGELVAEAVAGSLGYAVAFGLGWWRPRRSPDPAGSAGRTAVVLALLGAVLLPICYWNPMPLTFAASALLLLRWGRTAGGTTGIDPRLRRSAAALSVVVVAVQVVAFVVHVVLSSSN